MLVVAGLSNAGAQLIFALTGRPILRSLEAAPARQRERVLYLVQISPIFLAVFAAAGLFLPAYLQSEPHSNVEHVSIACILIASTLSLWFASAVLRGLRIALRTIRFANACRRAGGAIAQSDGLAVVRVRNFNLPVALIGFLHPLVVVSDEFAGIADRLDPDAFAVALSHEHAHAVHCDNWKLLCLVFVPSLDRFLYGCPPWRELWQVAADWAADDEAVQGDLARSLLLADVLVQAARHARGPRPLGVCTALTSAEAGLAARVARLAHPDLTSDTGHRLFVPCLAVLTALIGAGVAASPWIYSLAEKLLHFGAA